MGPASSCAIGATEGALELRPRGWGAVCVFVAKVCSVSRWSRLDPTEAVVGYVSLQAFFFFFIGFDAVLCNPPFYAAAVNGVSSHLQP